jgi:hypothetical protein
MTPLIAQLTTDAKQADRRGAARRTLNLQVHSQYLEADALVLIHNLSRNGLLIETMAPLEPGETIEVQLPEAGTTRARIVRSDGDYHGCRFISPISKAAVSAALLKSPSASYSNPLPAPQLAMAAALHDDVWSDPHEPEIAPTERALLYGFLVLAALAVAGLIYALFVLSVGA